MTPAQLTPNPLPDEDDAETPQTPPASDADDAPTPKREDEAPAKAIRRAKRSYTPPPNKPTSVHLSPTASSRNPKTIGMPKAPIEYAHEIKQCTFSPRVREAASFVKSRRSAAPPLYTPPERHRCDARRKVARHGTRRRDAPKGRRVTHASLVGSLWRAPRLLSLASGLRLEAFRRRPRPGAGWG